MLGIIRKEEKFRGVVPLHKRINKQEIRISFNVPSPPLILDTINVRKAHNYGFNVITKEGIDIIKEIRLQNDTIILSCSKSPVHCKVRYGVNGEYKKSGWRIGPRGNLRDSDEDQHWCYFFEL